MLPGSTCPGQRTKKGYAMLKAKHAYLQTQATTTSQGDLVVMLYDGAINFLRRAKQKIEEKDFAEKGILISKALDVIQEMDSSLNMEKGGELSKNLHSLYTYAQGKLLQANLKMNQDYVEEVIKILSSLREAFASITNSPEALQAQKEAPAQMPVNASQFRETGPFGINVQKQPAAPQTPAPNASFGAKAYLQQAAVFGSHTNAQLSPPAQGHPENIRSEAVSLTAARVAEPVQVPQKQPEQETVLKAKANPEPPAQNPQAAALTGFARQMINNSLYKKMAMNASTQAAEK